MAFNPFETRDYHGRWSKVASALKQLAKEFEQSSKVNVSKAQRRLLDRAIEDRGNAPKLAPKSVAVSKVYPLHVHLDQLAKSIRHEAVAANKTNPKQAQQLRKKARGVEAVRDAAKKHEPYANAKDAKPDPTPKPTATPTTKTTGSPYKAEGLNAKRNVKHMALEKLQAIAAADPSNADEKTLHTKVLAELEARDKKVAVAEKVKAAATPSPGMKDRAKAEAAVKAAVQRELGKAYSKGKWPKQYLPRAEAYYLKQTHEHVDWADPASVVAMLEVYHKKYNLNNAKYDYTKQKSVEYPFMPQHVQAALEAALAKVPGKAVPPKTDDPNAVKVLRKGDNTWEVFQGGEQLGIIRQSLPPGLDYHNFQKDYEAAPTGFKPSWPKWFKEHGVFSAKYGKQTVAQGDSPEAAADALVAYIKDELEKAKIEAAKPKPPPSAIPKGPAVKLAGLVNESDLKNGMSVKVLADPAGEHPQFSGKIVGKTKQTGRIVVEERKTKKRRAVDVSFIRPRQPKGKKAKAAGQLQHQQHGPWKAGDSAKYVAIDGSFHTGEVSKLLPNGMVSVTAPGDKEVELHRSSLLKPYEEIPEKILFSYSKAKAKQAQYVAGDHVQYSVPWPEGSGVKRGYIRTTSSHGGTGAKTFHITAEPTGPYYGDQSDKVEAVYVEGKVVDGKVVKPSQYVGTQLTVAARVYDQLRQMVRGEPQNRAEEDLKTGVLSATGTAKRRRVEISPAAKTYLMTGGLDKLKTTPAVKDRIREILTTGEGRAVKKGPLVAQYSVVGNQPLPKEEYKPKRQPRSGTDLLEELTRGIDRQQNLKALDPRKRELPNGARAGHAQQLMYDLAVGHQRGSYEPPRIVPDHEYVKRLEDAGVLDRKAFAATVPLKLPTQVQRRLNPETGKSEVVQAFENDPYFHQRKGSSTASYHAPGTLSPDDMRRVQAAVGYKQQWQARDWSMAHPDGTFLQFARSIPEDQLTDLPSGTIRKAELKREAEVAKKYDEVANREIAKLRQDENTVPFGYNLPTWSTMEMEPQKWDDVNIRIEQSARGSYVPSFYTHSVTEDGVLYHRRAVTTSRVVKEGDDFVTKALNKAGAKLVINSKNIDPGYRGRGEISAGQMLMIEEEPGTADPKKALAKAKAHALELFDEDFSSATSDEEHNSKQHPTAEARQAAAARAKAYREARSRIETADTASALFAAIQGVTLPAGTEPWKMVAISSFRNTARDPVEAILHQREGGKRIEYVPHNQSGAKSYQVPTSQRGRLTLEGYTPEEASKKLQELGIVGDLEEQVPFKAIMRSNRREGLVLPLLGDYLRGEAAPPVSKHLITHGITSAHGNGAVKIMESILEGGGIHSIAERFRRGIKVRSSSPSGDIRSGIDHIVFCALDSGGTCGSGSPIRVAMKPEAFMRRDIAMAPRDFGGMGSRYDHYKDYLNKLRKQTGHRTGSLYDPSEPEPRQIHLQKMSASPGSSEFNIGGSIPVEDMAIIGVQSQEMADRVNKLLDRLMQEGKITSRPTVVLGRDAFRRETTSS
jgi:hypothetical protein